MSLNKDVFASLFLMLVCGTFIYASFDIQSIGFGQMHPALWPRIILAPLTLLCAVLFLQSFFKKDHVPENRGGLSGWFVYYKNPLLSFLMFFTFLLTLPYFGMLMGGTLFVFFMLCILGGWTGRQLLQHGLISIAMVGAMWTIFAFALGVFLPKSIFFNAF